MRITSRMLEIKIDNSSLLCIKQTEILYSSCQECRLIRSPISLAIFLKGLSQRCLHLLFIRPQFQFEWRSYLRLRQTCRGMDELVRSNITVRMDRRLRWDLECEITNKEESEGGGLRFRQAFCWTVDEGEATVDGLIVRINEAGKNSVKLKLPSFQANSANTQHSPIPSVSIASMGFDLMISIPEKVSLLTLYLPLPIVYNSRESSRSFVTFSRNVELPPSSYRSPPSPD